MGRAIKSCSSLPLQRQRIRTEGRPASAAHIRQPSFTSNPRATCIPSFTSFSTAHVKVCRSSSSCSSSPPSPLSSSSTSPDSLPPPLFNFKCSRRHRQWWFPLPRAPWILVNFQCPTTPVDPEALKFYLQIPSSADPPLSITREKPNSTIVSQPQLNAGGTQCEDIMKHGGEVDKEKDDRKLRTWRAACAMAHAYLQEDDVHLDELHQHGLNESAISDKYDVQSLPYQINMMYIDMNYIYMAYMSMTYKVTWAV